LRRDTCCWLLQIVLPAQRSRNVRASETANEIIYLYTIIHRAKTTWNSIEQDVLDARQQVAAVDQKQIAVVQSNP